MGKRKPNPNPLPGESPDLPSTAQLQVLEEFRQRQRLQDFASYLVYGGWQAPGPLAAFHRKRDADRFCLLDRLEAAARACHKEGRSASDWHDLGAVLEELDKVGT